MKIRTLEHKKNITKDSSGEINGFLIPLYNINDNFFEMGKEPKQVYLTTILPGKYKGPHLHHIRTGFFTCICGNIKIILKTNEGYMEFFSGEEYNFRSIEIPTGIPVLIQNIGENEALILNMPNPAWAQDMNDEFTADFSDYFMQVKK